MTDDSLGIADREVFGLLLCHSDIYSVETTSDHLQLVCREMLHGGMRRLKPCIMLASCSLMQPKTCANRSDDGWTEWDKRCVMYNRY